MSQHDETTQRLMIASKLDSFRFARFLAATRLRGAFTRSCIWEMLVPAISRDPLGFRAIGQLREKYPADFVMLRLGVKMLLVFSREGIRDVLQNSPRIYGVPDIKRDGMRRFQPDAATISGEYWQHRRTFNEQVLNLENTVHQYAGNFLELIKSECESLGREAGSQPKWLHFRRLFARISLGIIFGSAAVDDAYLVSSLKTLMQSGNHASLLPDNPSLRNSLFQAMRGYLRRPESGTLVELAKEHTQAAEFPEVIKCESQIVHWMFAMNETLAANTVRALALIAAHNETQQSLRAEIREAHNPHTIDRMSLLGGCLQEAMRLWPTTPVLLRRTTRADDLCGNNIEEGTDVLILNAFNNRNLGIDKGHGFWPERWLDDSVDREAFTHFGGGPQYCAGKNLAMWIGKAVLATLLKKTEFALKRPRLTQNEPMPHALNYFRTEFTCRHED